MRTRVMTKMRTRVITKMKLRRTKGLVLAAKRKGKTKIET